MVTTRTDRRHFLGFVTQLLMVLLGLMAAIPAVAYFLGPLRRQSADEGPGRGFLDVGPVASFPVEEWFLASLEMVQADGWRRTRVRRALWVRRQGDGGIAVLSSICPHLGCPINWHPDQSQFVCPCHGGVFNTTGQVTSGPPPRSMDHLEQEVRGGRLWVRWQDFKIGVADRVPVSV